MDDERLITLVQQYPVLFDLSHEKYMDTGFKLDIWRKIGNEMKSDDSSCKTRWNNIRDNYRKSIKKSITKSGQGSKKIKLYKYSKQMSFLKKHFNDRETKRSIGNEVHGEDNLTHEEQDTQEEENIKDDEGETNETDGTEVIQAGSTQNYKNTQIKTKNHRSPTKKMQPEQAASPKLLEYIIEKNQNEPTTQQHPVDAFLAGIAPTLKSLPPYYLSLAKSEIFNTVQNYEMKMIMNEYQFQQNPEHNFNHDITQHSSHSSNTTPSVSTLVIEKHERTT